MKLTTRSRYGLRAMTYISLHTVGDETVALSEISKELRLSDYYLEQLLRALKQGGYIDSVRGAQGGYRLAKPAKEIMVFDVLTLLEGPLWLAECIHAGDCPGGFSNCPTRIIISRMADAIRESLDGVSLADMAEMERAI